MRHLNAPTLGLVVNGKTRQGGSYGYGYEYGYGPDRNGTSAPTEKVRS